MERDRTVAGAQLVERSHPTPEVHGSNPVIGKLSYRTFVYCRLEREDENKEKEAENGPFLKREREKEKGDAIERRRDKSEEKLRNHF